ncbi:MAG: hypothetical protein V3T72_00580, partial [Thermoanaerobaculia bacterium]
EAEEARRQEKIARDEKIRADDKAAEALRQEEIAREEKIRADDKAEEARRQEKIAREEKKRADEKAAEAVSRRLVAEAKALAVRTLTMQGDSEREVATLLALHAYRLHQEHREGEEDPDIHKALQQASQYYDLDPTELRKTDPDTHGHEDTIRVLAVVPNRPDPGDPPPRRLLASGSDDGAVYLTDLATDFPPTPQPLGSGDSGPRSSIRALAFDPLGEHLVAGGFDGSIRMWDLPARLEGAAELTKPTLLQEADSPWIVESLVFRPGAGKLAVARSSKPRAGKRAEASLEIRTLKAKGERHAVEDSWPLRSLAFNADGSLLAAAGGKAGALVWTVDDPEEPRTDLVLTARPLLPECKCDLRSVAFRGEGSQLAGGSVDGRLFLWTLGDDTLRAGPPPAGPPPGFSAHAARIQSLAFQPQQDQVLASASFDGTVRLWNVDNLQALPVVLEPRRSSDNGWVWAVVYEPGGEWLISGGGDRTLRLWTTSSRELVGPLCASLPAGRRDLTADERSKYLSWLSDDDQDEKPCLEGEG